MVIRKVTRLAASLFLSCCVFLTQAQAENPHVLLHTDLGDIVIELYADKAPVTVYNFIKNTNNYHYDGLIFHRVIRGFMIQTGGHTFDLSYR